MNKFVDELNFGCVPGSKLEVRTRNFAIHSRCNTIEQSTVHTKVLQHSAMVLSKRWIHVVKNLHHTCFPIHPCNGWGYRATPILCCYTFIVANQQRKISPQPSGTMLVLINVSGLKRVNYLRPTGSFLKNLLKYFCSVPQWIICIF